ALGAGGADRAQDDVVAACGAEALELLGALLRRADDAVLTRERLEVLRVALREGFGPDRFGGFPVAADRDERQVRGREAMQLATGGGRRGSDLVEALGIALRLHDVGDPAVALAAGARERGSGAAADPDRGSRLLHGLGIERHVGKLRESSLEAGRRVAPERAHDVDRLAHARAALAVRDARDFELLGVLSADADAKDEAPSGQHVERRG